jgi:hypothetical protein
LETELHFYEYNLYMATYKQSINFLPTITKEQEKEEIKFSKTAIYAALLPFLASIIWVIAMLMNLYYKGEVGKVDTEITTKNKQIATYNDIRMKQTELVLKVDALKDLVTKNFYPQEFFDNINRTIKATGDAQAEVYSYGRTEDGTFNIKGRAHSYLDLAKIMVVFSAQKGFGNVEIKSISYSRESNNVNFEITFNYVELEKTS